MIEIGIAVLVLISLVLVALWLIVKWLRELKVWIVGERPRASSGNGNLALAKTQPESFSQLTTKAAAENHIDSQGRRDFSPPRAPHEISLNPALLDDRSDWAEGAHTLLEPAPCGAQESSTCRENLHQRRPRLRWLDPEHFRRHAGVPGWLYLARNYEHAEGIFKIGYTTNSVSVRIEQLTLQNQQASGIGRFTLIKRVPVDASFDCEQALFAALACRRIQGKEFFLGTEDELVAAMLAAAQLTADLGASLDALEIKNIPFPSAPVVDFSQSEEAGTGWVHLLQSRYYPSNYFRLLVSAGPASRVEASLRRRSRRATAALGEFVVVRSIPVGGLTEVRQRLREVLRPMRLRSRSIWVRCNPDELTQIVSSNTQQTQPLADHEFDTAATCPIKVQIVNMPHPSWQPWTSECPHCRMLLRFLGPIPSEALLSCPKCNGSIHCVIRGRGVQVSAHND